MSERVELRISADRCRARLTAVRPGDTVEAILYLLRRHKIRVGVRQEVIEAAVEAAHAENQAQLNVLVAESRHPQPASAELAVPRGPAPPEPPPALDEVVAALGTGDPALVADACIGKMGWWVKPGAVLAERWVDGGVDGVDLWGVPIPAPVPKALQAPMGPGVAPSEDGRSFVATIPGYAGTVQGVLRVQIPVWVSKEAYEAGMWVLRRLPNTAAPSRALALAALAEAGVKTGVNTQAVERWCGLAAAESAPEQILLVVARAIMPEPPGPHRPKFSFDPEFRAGTLREDGSTNFRERNLYPPVTEGQLLAELLPPEPGPPGTDVRGRPIPAPLPATAQLAATEGVRHEVEETEEGAEEDGPRIERLFALTDGGASVKRELRNSRAGPVTVWTLGVLPVAHIRGDVNYGTGHIDFRGNVVIDGSVREGFKVKAAGDVIVQVGVEPRAQIEAGGHVRIGLSVIGAETTIRAGGDLQAAFVQAATLHAEGNVMITRYAHDAIITSRGWIEALGAGKKQGSLVGGTLSAREGVDVRSLGSEWTQDTQVTVGLDVSLETAIADAREAERGARKALERLAQKLGIEALDEGAVRELLKTHPERRDELVALLRRAQPHVRMALEQQNARLAFEEQRATVHLDARVRARDIAHPGVVVRIGETVRTIPRTLKASVIYLERDDEGAQIRWEDVSKRPGRESVE